MKLKRKKCVCGNVFIPNNTRNIRCPLCSGNADRVKRFLNKRKRGADMKYQVKNLDDMTLYQEEYREKNKEHIRELNRQRYIKFNLKI